MKLLNNIKSLFNIIQKLNRILTKPQKKRGSFVLINMFIASILDTLGVAAILPFITSLTDIDLMKRQWYIQRIVSFFHIRSDIGIVVFIGISIIVLYIVKNLYLWWNQCLLIHFQCGVQQELSVRMLSSYMSRPYSFFRNTNNGVIFRGINEDVYAVYSIIYTLFTSVSQFLTIILLIMFLVMQDPAMSLGLGLAGFICAIVFVLLLKNKVSEAGKEAKESSEARTVASYQAIEGVKEIYVMHRQSFFVSKYNKAYDKQTKAQITQNEINAAPVRIIETVFILFIIGIVCIKLVNGFNPVEYVPQLSVFVVAAFRMMPIITGIPYCVNQLIYYAPLLDEAYENIETARATNNTIDNVEVSDLFNRCSLAFIDKISIDNVFYRYEDGIKDVLHDLNLDIYRGQSIGLIGESGAGKSTLADMIMGLQKPTKGSITVDGTDIYSIPNEWARMIGYIPQTVFMLGDTVRNNVTFGIAEDEISEEKVWEALSKAHIDKFVKELPLGLNTVIGERGIKFSGGQRQRVAIARALYYNPQILVMDEATSALDNDTETAVMESIEELQGKLTLIIIAHRLSTTRKCDHIYEIVDGKAIERDKKELFES